MGETNKKVEENEEPDKNQAEAQIQMILQEMCIAGAISSEGGDMMNILNQLKSGAIAPKEAVRMAREIEANRQENYH